MIQAQDVGWQVGGEGYVCVYVGRRFFGGGGGRQSVA